MPDPTTRDSAATLTAEQVRGVLQFAEGWLWGASLEAASKYVQDRMDEMVEVYMRDCNYAATGILRGDSNTWAYVCSLCEHTFGAFISEDRARAYATLHASECPDA